MSKQFNVRLTDRLYNRLMLYAKQSGLPSSEVVRAALDKYLRTYKNPTNPAEFWECLTMESRARVQEDLYGYEGKLIEYIYEQYKKAAAEANVDLDDYLEPNEYVDGYFNQIRKGV